MSEISLNWSEILSPYADYLRARFGIDDPKKQLGRIIGYLEDGKIPYRCIHSHGRVVAYAILAYSNISDERMIGNLGFVSESDYTPERLKLLLSWMVEFSSKISKKVYLDEPFNVALKDAEPIINESGFRKIERFKMEAFLAPFSVEVKLEDVKLVPLEHDSAQNLAEYEFSAFLDSPDKILFPETARERAMFFSESLISGNYGSLVNNASFMASTESEFAGAIISMDNGAKGSEKNALIRTLFVMPGFRKRGLGRLLLLRAMDELTRNGYGKVWLQVNSLNLSAITLYKKTGFFESPEPHEIFYVSL